MPTNFCEEDNKMENKTQFPIQYASPASYGSLMETHRDDRISFEPPASLVRWGAEQVKQRRPLEKVYPILNARPEQAQFRWRGGLPPDTESKAFWTPQEQTSPTLHIH